MHTKILTGIDWIAGKTKKAHKTYKEQRQKWRIQEHHLTRGARSDC